VADDLRLFLEDKPIRARRPSLWQRALKWARRHKTVVRAAGVVLALGVAALLVSTALIWRANQDLRQSLYYQRIALAERESSANNLSRVEQLLEECPADLRGWEWHYLKRLRHQTLSPLPHDTMVLCVAYSPTGQWLASGSQDGIIKVWDAQTGESLWGRGLPAGQNLVFSLAFSPECEDLGRTNPKATPCVAGPPQPGELRGI
jgi:eukaryotic-like serine/threonine-protein kinase